MKKIVLLLLFFVALAPLQAAAQQWHLDTVHTNFFFDVKHTYATVRGQFMDFSGDVYFDPDHPEKSRFDFVIKVNSFDTKAGKRDTHLRSPDFFDTAKYPFMTFKSARVLSAGDNKYIGDGKFHKMGVVGKDVDILFTLELLRDK